MRIPTLGATTIVLAAMLGVLVSPAAGTAKSLCIDNSIDGRILTIPKSKVKRGTAAPVVGYYSTGGNGTPAFGTVIANQAGTIYAFSLERGQASLPGSSAGADNDPINFILNVADGSPDVGDTGSGYIDGASTDFFVVNCVYMLP